MEKDIRKIYTIFKRINTISTPVYICLLKRGKLNYITWFFVIYDSVHITI